MSCTLSAVVVAYDSEAMLPDCLTALDAALADVPDSELVLVLNGPAGSARLPTGISPARIVEPGENLGFAGGIAAALDVAAGEWIAIVNDDCLVEPNALRELLAVGRGGDDVGSVAAQIRFLEARDTINSAGLEIDELGIAFERLLGEPVTGAAGEPVETFGASATFALYRRRMLEEVGGLDTSFFAYLEDADLAWRARMRGWRTLYAPRAVGYHRHSASLGHASSAKQFLVGRNRVRMLAKNATGAQLRRRLPMAVLYDAAYIIFVAVRGRNLAPLRGRLQGLGDWSSYRRAGAATRRPVALAPAQGLAAALRRNGAYDAFSSGGAA